MFRNGSLSAPTKKEGTRSAGLGRPLPVAGEAARLAGGHNEGGDAAELLGLLKAELKRRNIGYRELAERLGAMGVHDSERNIANKISRGGFTAVFLVQCLEAIGTTSLRPSDWRS